MLFDHDLENEIREYKTRGTAGRPRQNESALSPTRLAPKPVPSSALDRLGPNPNAIQPLGHRLRGANRFPGPSSSKLFAYDSGVSSDDEDQKDKVRASGKKKFKKTRRPRVLETKSIDAIKKWITSNK